MASRKDYYDILGIRRGATEEEIERAYRKLTRTYQFDPHLSNHKTVEFRFKEISEAYEILSNKEKREKYDRAGDEILFSDFDWEYDLEEGEEKESNFEGFEDIFESYFGSEEQAALRQPQRGKDLYSTVEIRLEEAVAGTLKEVQVFRDISCFRCLGKGVDLTGPQKVCDECGGAGQVQVGLPPSAFSQTCSRCRGEGKVHIQLCEACCGKGRVAQKEVVGLQIPPGADNGCCIYLSGKGQPGKNGGRWGDLVVDVRVQKHPDFQRKGDDLHLEVPLAVWEAALGAEVEVPTLDGPAILTVPQGLKNGEQLRLPGKGVPYFCGGGRGDQVVSFKIVLPQNLDDKSKQLLEELKRLNPKDPRPRCR
jgi:molecular chaperone DnaJ